MLISVSGNIGSGKDKTGKIIQALINFPKANTASIHRVILGETDNNLAQIKKWAEKLKVILALLIGCKREQLEDEEFKNTVLGEEWWHWIETSSYNNAHGKIIPYIGNENTVFSHWTLVKMTPRLLLQLLGTECGRQILHPNIWVNALMSEYKAKPKVKDYSTKVWSVNDYSCLCHTCEKRFSSPNKRAYMCGECCSKQDEIYPTWIITDTRFLNELEAVKSRKGITIKLNRGVEVKREEDSFWLNYEEWLFETKGIKPHKSEIALDKADFDYTITNRGTIEELIDKVREILIKEKII